jgi:hypothetical protein
LTLSYLNRVFLFNKAVRKAKIKPHYIFILYSVHLHQPCNWQTIFNQLKSVKRIWGANYYSKRIKDLVNLNYIARDSEQLFYLTPSGIALLKDIENRLRKERHDK